ncbi:hypothetical protein HYQ46_006823 [Verticillium longisporum]|nr:hypothetical protein HYQ46_006823 [Verticillium longisporum]
MPSIADHIGSDDMEEVVAAATTAASCTSKVEGIPSVDFRGGNTSALRLGTLVTLAGIKSAADPSSPSAAILSTSPATATVCVNDGGISRPAVWKKRLGLANASNSETGAPNRSGMASRRTRSAEPSSGGGTGVVLPR